MSGENPTNNNEQTTALGAAALENMPSFAEHMKTQNQEKPKTFSELDKSEIPDGVRDEQDYQEYLAEKNARNQESIAEQKAALQEKAERVSSFENRLEANKDLYDELAEYRAFLTKLYPDVAIIADNSIAHDDMNRRYGKNHHAGFEAGEPEEHAALAYRNAKFLMQCLSDGVEANNSTIEDALDSSSLTELYESDKVANMFNNYEREHPDKDVSEVPVRIGVGKVIDKEAFEYNKSLYEKAMGAVVEKRSQEFFDSRLTGFAFSKSALEYWHKHLLHVPEETLTKARTEAKEMMDGRKYEAPLDEIIDKRRNFTATDIQKFDDLYIPNSDDMFTTTGYEYDSMPTFIPGLETTYRIIEKRIRAEQLIVEDRVRRFESHTGRERGKKMYDLLVNK